MEQYKDIIDHICNSIHTGLVDFDQPRSEASMPTQASSEFITNKQQGDWAENVIFRAINDNSKNIIAVRYENQMILLLVTLVLKNSSTIIKTSLTL